MLENELEKYSPLNRYFLGKSYFEDDGKQNYLIFQPMSRYLKFVTNSQNISSWRSKGLSDEEIKVVNGLYPSNYVNKKLRLKFEGNCLAQTKVTYTHKNIVNIVYCVWNRRYNKKFLWSKTDKQFIRFIAAQLLVFQVVDLVIMY